ncbi:ribonuclease PH [Dissulfurirhabdus thermomarina]|uniref:Ribonuclease PH n=1 Tax=Dissulfurirhabdus thermomarina TaxID=1765737 RepID=A0A6N9TKW0_DISTH|nr:ribonuclease PH [Dissulfurirhabdus thermomarina]NDY41708.1 ribonuclease PH [Dissulfurirhabdus thermomarina]NMX23193.1 ribonuclease PH [Dissulfurirhabdus thermomarina]
MRRPDGRAHDEVRPITVQHGYLAHAEGSVLYRQGQTWVLCAVTAEAEVPPFLRDSGSGWITAEYAMLPRSTAVRVPREGRAGAVRGRTHEIQRLIGRSLRAVVDLEALGPLTLRVDCDVLQADGGTRTASVTGAFLALRDAVATLLEQGRIDEDPVRDTLAAVSAGIVDGTALLDLDYAEDAAAEVDANFVLTGSGRLVEVQATAEAAPFEWAEFESLAALARFGVEVILARVAS